MAEMLVRIVDKTSQDPAKHAQLTKRGDVITIQEDGWEWSAEERSGTHWQIVKVPGVPPSDLSAFLAAEPEDGTPKLLQRRAFKFDIDKHDGKSLLRTQALSMKVKKQPIPDPSSL